MAALTKEQVYKLALNRMNYTWEPDEAQSANVNAAIEEAEALLRARAGSPDLDLTGPEYRGLLIECVWYLANNRLWQRRKYSLNPSRMAFANCGSWTVENGLFCCCPVYATGSARSANAAILTLSKPDTPFKCLFGFRKWTL